MASNVLKTTLKIMASADGSVKSSFQKVSKMIDKLKHKAESTSTMPGENNFDKISMMTSDMKRVGDSFKRVGGNIQNVGMKLTPVSMAAQGAIGASIKMASDFDNGMAKVNTIAGLSGSKLSGLSKDLLQVSSDTGQSASDIAEAAYQSLSASVPTNQVAKFTKTAANLAKTGFTDTASAVDVLSTAINAYGLKTSEASKLSDMLIQTQNRGKITVNELATQMGNVIPTASALGVNMANLSTGYVQLTKQGINAAASTTELRAMLNELSKSGSGVSKVLKKQTGKDFTSLMKSGKSLGDVMQILGDSVKGNKTEFKNLWSNSRAGAGALALLNAGSKDFNKQLKDMNSSTGNVDDALEKMNTKSAKIKKSLNQAKNSAIIFGATIMDSATPAIDSFSKTVGMLTDDFDALPASEKKAVANIMLVTAAAGPATVAIGKVVSVTGSAINTTANAIDKTAKLVKAFKALPTATEAAAAGEKVLTSGLASTTAVAGGTIAAVAALSVVMLSQRHNFQASAKDVDKLTGKYNDAANKTEDLISASEKQISSADSSMSSINQQGAVASDLAAKIKKLSGVENKSTAQKKKLKSEVAALNNVVPGLNLSYSEEKDKLSKTNDEIVKNIALLKQQSIAKQAAKNVSGLTSKRSQLEIQSSTNSVNIEEQSSKVAVLEEKQKKALMTYKKLSSDPSANAGDVSKARHELSKYTSLLIKGRKSLDRYKSKQKDLNKEIGKIDSAINEQSFSAALAQAKESGKEVPSKIAAGIKSTMKVLPATAKELATTVKYEPVIKKAKDAGIKIPKAMSQKIVSGKITVKKAESQINSVIRFENASKKAKNAGIKIPKSLAKGVDSGKISASKATSRINNIIKFDKAVKKAKSQGIKIPSGLAKAVASGKLSAQQASQKIGNASVSKLDKSKDAKSKGLKTNKNFASGVGQTAAPSAAGLRASNAGVAPFKKVPDRVGTALAGLSAKIHDAFTFKIPHIPIPHPGVTGHFDLKKGTVPHFSMNWYKNGGIMTRPTVFGASGNKLLAGGEAGPEGIIPLNKLWKNMDRAIASTVNTNVRNIYNDAGPVSTSFSPVKNSIVNVNNYATTDSINQTSNYQNVSNSVNSLAKNISSLSNSYASYKNTRTNSKNENLYAQSYAKTVNHLSKITDSASNVMRSSTKNTSLNTASTQNSAYFMRQALSSMYQSDKNSYVYKNGSKIANNALKLSSLTTKNENNDVNTSSLYNVIANKVSSKITDSASNVMRSNASTSKETVDLSSKTLKKSIVSTKLLQNVSNPLFNMIKAAIDSVSVKKVSNNMAFGGMPVNTTTFNHLVKSGDLNKSNVFNGGSLSGGYGRSLGISETIRSGSLSRQSQLSGHYGSSVANVNRSASHKSVNISGITFAPNIVIKGNADKQDIIDALKEVEDEFKDYLSEIQADEEDSSYA